jgi:3-vinyl bacteriochlorophyllide hydratase
MIENGRKYVKHCLRLSQLTLSQSCSSLLTRQKGACLLFTSPPIRSLPSSPKRRVPLYSPEERRRRDASPWTWVQGLLAPVQFIACAVSVVLVLRYLATGDGLFAASVSFVVKTALLYLIMVTGSVWEKVVFGKWLFAPAFFWEDVVSMLVLALHTACLVAMATGWLDARAQMLLALAAYAAYAVNATQFLLKLRAARRDDQRRHSGKEAMA